MSAPALMLALCAALAGESPGSAAREADASWREPRTPERVARSVEICEAGIARGENGGLNWRAARACVWLGRNLADKKDRREYSRRAVEHAEREIQEAPASPQGYYLLALALGAVSKVERTSKWLDRMEELGRKLIEIDERFDRAAGHRYLGILYHRAGNYPFVGVGSMREAEEELRRACELFPEYPYNQLLLGKVLADRKKRDEARACLERVVRSAPPPDETADHTQWVAEARTLLEKISPR